MSHEKSEKYRESVSASGKEFLTVSDLCEIFQLSRYVIDRMLKTGEFPTAKVGGQYRVRSADLDKWWNERVRQEQKNVLKDCLPRKSIK